MTTNYIVGHKNPDTDSVAAAIALAELKAKLGEGEPVAGRAGEPTAEALHVLKKFGIEPPTLLEADMLNPSDRITLVDHNEESQRLEGLDPSQIVEIIDHHRVNLKLAKPIKITVLPWGSTATIIFDFAQQKGIKFSQKTAKLLLAAILSDTLGLRSPTTTDHDRRAIEKLRKIAKIEDIEALTLEIFKAKSDISGLTPKEVITNDQKVYDFAGRKTLIGQLETVEQDKIIADKERYLKAMADIKKGGNFNLALFAVTDPLKKNTKILYPSEEERTVLEVAFRTEGKDGVADIGPRLSRKKEMVPEIEKAVTIPTNG